MVLGNWPQARVKAPVSAVGPPVKEGVSTTLILELAKSLGGLSVSGGSHEHDHVPEG